MKCLSFICILSRNILSLAVRFYSWIFLGTGASGNISQIGIKSSRLLYSKFLKAFRVIRIGQRGPIICQPRKEADKVFLIHSIIKKNKEYIAFACDFSFGGKHSCVFHFVARVSP